MSAAEPLIEPAAPAPAPVAPAAPAPVAPASAAPEPPTGPKVTPLKGYTPPAPADPKGVPRGTPAPHDPSLETTAEWAKDMLPHEKVWIKARGLEGKTQADLARQFQNLETFKGIPADQILKKPDWTDAESVEGYRKALNLPETPEGYAASKIPMALGELDAGEMRPMAHAAALSPQQFDIVTNWAAQYLSQQHTSNMELIALDEANQMAEYTRKMGAALPEQTALVDRAIAAFEIAPEELSKLQNGLEGEANVRRFLARLGSKFAEAKAPPGNQDPGFGGMTPEVAKGELMRLQSTPGYLATITETSPQFSPDALAKRQKLQALAFSTQG